MESTVSTILTELKGGATVEQIRTALRKKNNLVTASEVLGALERLERKRLVTSTLAKSNGQKGTESSYIYKLVSTSPKRKSA